MCRILKKIITAFVRIKYEEQVISKLDENNIN